MFRCKSCFSRHLPWYSPVTQGLVLCVLTFGVVLPLCCNHLLYSYYFLKVLYLDSMSERTLQDSYERGQDALRFWQDFAYRKASAVTITTSPKVPELLVTVVTTRRTEGEDSHYLLQVMQRLTSLLGTCGERPCAEIIICDVESGHLENVDAALLENQFLVVRRTPEERWKSRGHLNTFEREKKDYVFCLRKGWELRRPQNVVVLEDDALPRLDFFAVIKDLLSRSFARQTLYVKLYHPERLQRYWNPEPYRILEWIGLGLVGATVILAVLSCFSSGYFSPVCFLFFTLYVMVTVELAGRHYLLEVRRISPQLYTVSPATECCTPAILYPGNSSIRTAKYLDQEFCFNGNAKDTVMHKIARTTRGERAHSVEPNLISHIGAYSSVRPNPARPKLL
ncbi:post-GPI attachment to proteins factor 4 [Denticeps clupeoides]|uniref:Transmembrane protein 246 n=1 Tax=Denticeps clupeoides TaxID=299321 RepID=A0AAY4AIB4_9TELE|nr:transmembrane protein 246 [Denticeps clupeoides]XP_028829969.1 transmembrane protein 246 [Denticeps clupeoides]XP_028829970.1 transmembrane protein 246 [Denticeps clupeoides]